MRVSSFSPCVFHSPNKNDVFVFYSRRKHLPLEDQLLSFIWRSRVKFTDKMINLLLNQHYPIPHTHTPSHLKTTISYNNWPMLAVQLHLNCIAIHWYRLQVGLIEISEGIRHISEGLEITTTTQFFTTIWLTFNTLALQWMRILIEKPLQHCMRNTLTTRKSL